VHEEVAAAAHSHLASYHGFKIDATLVAHANAVRDKEEEEEEEWWWWSHYRAIAAPISSVIHNISRKCFFSSFVLHCSDYGEKDSYPNCNYCLVETNHDLPSRRVSIFVSCHQQVSFMS